MTSGRELLFAKLFDDAAIFPPGNLPMAEAVAAHLAAQQSPTAPFIGPFVCSAARLSELGEVCGSSTLELALTTSAADYPEAVHTVLSDPRFRLRAVEVHSHDVMLPVAELPSAATIYLELGWGTQADLPPGTALKFRTGGLTADAFPSEDQLARALCRCAEQGISFKLTAGLHRGVRHRDPLTGFEQHGFLNVMLATLAALDGAAHDAVAALLAQRDRAEVAAGISSMSGADIDRVRGHFRSLGTCNVDEPIADLYDLDLLEATHD